MTLRAGRESLLVEMSFFLGAVGVAVTVVVGVVVVVRQR